MIWNVLRRYCSLCLLILCIGLSGCSSVSRLNSPEETPPSGESGQVPQQTVRQQEPEEQKPPESLTKKILFAPVRIPIWLIKTAIAIPKFIITLPFRPFMSKPDPVPVEPVVPIPPSVAAGQIIPAQQQQAAYPSGGVGIVSAAPTALSVELQQISTELRMISQELKQITEILRYMSGAAPGTIPRPPSPPQIPETIRPVFPSDTTAARLRPSSQAGVQTVRQAVNTAQSALTEANTAVESLSGGMTIVPEPEAEPEPAMPTASYQLTISSVEKPDLVDIMGGMQDISSDDSGNLVYADGFVTFVWTIEPRDISVTFTNNSIDTLTILWKDAGFIDENNERHPVIHEKITYKNTESEQKPTIVMPKEKVSDVLYPTDYLIFNKSTGWLQYPIMPYTAFDLRTKTRATDEEFSALAGEYIGTSFQIAVPIQYREELFEYLFTFEVEDSFVSIEQQ